MDKTLTLPEIEAIESALVVGDDDDICGSIRSRLRQGGFFVHSIPTGREARQFIEGCAPTDVIIVGPIHPRTDVLELIAQIRKSRSWRDVPIIILSQRVSEQAIERAFALGADDVIVKPFEAETVFGRIRQLTNCCDGN